MRQIKSGALLLFLVVSLVIFFLDSRHVLDGFKSASSEVLAPLTVSVYQTKLGIESFFSFITFWKSGEARIKNLEERNLELVAFENQAKNFSRENAELRMQLGAASKSANIRRLLPAQVISVGQHLEIGAGTKDGVHSGETVVYKDNLVGRVSHSLDRESFVQLPIDSQTKIPVKIGRVTGLTVGQFNGAILLDKVAQNEQINISDIVLTSGEGGGYWPDMIVGRVRKILSAKTDLFVQAEVEPLVDYGSLTTVFVVLD